MPSIVTKPAPVVPPADAPPNTPIAKVPPHPMRFAINGTQHLLPQLQAMVQGEADLPDQYKALILSELGNIKTNAAQIDLHVVDHADGGISIQAHIKPIQLG